MVQEYKVTHPEKRILDAELIDSTTDKYMVNAVYTFEKPKRKKLEESLEYLVIHSNDLNIRFRVGGDGTTLYQYSGEGEISCIEKIKFEDDAEITNWLENKKSEPLKSVWKSPLYRFIWLHSSKRSVLYAGIHHSIIDGYSSVVLGELLDWIYNSKLKGKAMPELTGNYFAYTAAEDKYLASEQFETDKKFWNSELEDIDEFPEAIPMEDETLYTEEIIFDSELTRSLKKWISMLPVRISPYKLAFALISAYLARRYQCKSVPVLMASANRRNLPEEMGEAMGMLVSTLLYKIDYNPEMSFQDFLIDVSEKIKKGLNYGGYPFDFLLDDLVSQGQSINSLFNFSVVSNSKIETEYDYKLLPNSATAFPVVFRVNTSKLDQNGLQQIDIEYGKDVFSSREISSVKEGLRAMLADIEKNPEKPLCHLEILGIEEKKTLLEDFQGEILEYNRAKTIVDFIADHGKNTPESRAVVDCNSSITYHELNEQSNVLAGILEKEYGISEDFVAVMLPRRKEFLVSVLGVMKTRSAYIPVDNEYPQDRIEYMIENSQSPVLITSKTFSNQLESYKGAILYIEDVDFTGDSHWSEKLPTGDNLAYMIYTSGSTGKPKGVMIRHKSLAAMTAWKTHDDFITSESRICVHSSFSFDASIIDLFPVLRNGGELHIISEAMRFDLAGFYTYIKEEGIENCALPTQLGTELLTTYDVPLKRVSLGGEKMKKLPKRNLDLINGYGPTEFTVCSSYFTVDQDEEYSNIPIGKPVANSWNYILDEHQELVPWGCPGELCISGLQISKGYLDLDEKTKAVFVDNPFKTCDENKMMYRTNDIVKWNENKELEISGRKDDQVKLRGFRIELGEIESTIQKIAGISSAVVMVYQDFLVCWYTADGQKDEDYILSCLSETLPDYMIPVAYMYLEKMPVKPGGKVDKKALPKIQLTGDTIVPPETGLQKEIFEIIAEVIDNDQFGINTDLFYVGMSSLSAIKITGMLSKKYHVSMNAKDVIKGKTIKAIEGLIIQGARTTEETFEKREYYPVTASQMGVYYDCAKTPTTTKYNIPSMVSLPENTDTNKLTEAFKRVVETHPYLKTQLVMQNKILMQMPTKEDINIPFAEVTEKELEVITENFVRPFNLFKTQLFKAFIYKTEKRVVLLTDFHHIIFDGGSLDIVLRDLSLAYQGKIIEPETFDSYQKAIKSEKTEESAEYKEAEAYFESRLKHCDGATLLTEDYHEEEGNQGILEEVIIPVKKNDVVLFSQSHGLTPNNLFLGAVTYTIARFTGSGNILLSTISNGRGDAAVQNTVGMMVKTLPLIITMDEKQNRMEYLTETQQSLFETMSKDCYPFTKISEKYHFSPEIMYAYQSGVVNNYEFEGKQSVVESLELKIPKFKISVHIEETAEDFKINVQYNGNIYKEETIRTFADSIRTVLNNIISQPEDLMITCSMVTKEEQEKLISFNNTADEHCPETLVGLFSQQVKNKGNKTALIAKDETLTYEKLNEKANRIANSLTEKGLQAEDRTALILPRDSRLIASMLGVMKAGGVYIPVDPEYPQKRIDHIMENSHGKFIITTEELADKLENKNILIVDELIAGGRPDNPAIRIEPQQLAYIIYTSGSTGLPKGVMLEHHGIANYVMPTEHNHHMRALVENNCTMVSITTVSFDMCLKEIYGSLMNGLTLVFAGEEETQNPNLLAALFEKTGGNAFNATPSRMEQYLDLPAFTKSIAGCKVVLAGGEKYPPVLYRKLRSITDAVLINTYGPTEITVSSNAALLDSDVITIGPPLANVREFVVDKHGNQMPVGVVGELWIGGTGVARGYWGNAAQTKDKFIEYMGHRVYKTGDLAKWTETGDIDILGRNDGQIKLRGLRIELDEIKNVISEYPTMKQVLVCIRKIKGTEQLCAYFVADSFIDKEDLREKISRSLTQYMIPAAFTQISAVPTTPNGKADMKALPEPELMNKQVYVEPTNEIEKDFCSIYENVLKLQQVGITDSFFDLGGTSLLVTKVTIEAMNKGYNISYGDVFLQKTPQKLAENLAQADQGPRSTDELGNYDYNAINTLLKNNTLESFKAGEKQKAGNVVLTGATGFLGIHVLRELLEHETGIIYCIVRKKKKFTLEQRLKTMLVYYFDNSYDEYFGNRLIPIEGDLTNPATFEELLSLDVHTFINCAANVKHYAADEQIEKINVRGVANAIDYCMKAECQLIQISTTSVAGMSVDNQLSADTIMDETMLYFGQNLENKYVNSKFRAERLVLEAVTKGLKGKIMRVGNLMARNADGEFQINFRTNGFINRLRGYEAIGKISYTAIGASTEFAPIDSTAAAIVKLIQAPVSCCLFHPYNNHEVYISDVIDAMNRQGIKIDVTEEEDFQKAFSGVMMAEEKDDDLVGLIAYMNMGKGKRVDMIPTNNRYTIQSLYRTGYKWPLTTDHYLSQFIGHLLGLGFFKGEENV
jgi:amino acid adenylation domain-containing protein